MLPRLLCFLSDVERALADDDPAPNDGRWDNSRTVNYSLDLASNLAFSSGNDLPSYKSEDPRVSTVRYHVLRVNASMLQPLFDRKWLWSLRGQVQYTPHALISGEQFGLGGASSVRADTDRATSAIEREWDTRRSPRS